MKLSGLILFDFDSDRISVKLSVRQLWPGNGSAQEVGWGTGSLVMNVCLLSKSKFSLQFAQVALAACGALSRVSIYLPHWFDDFSWILSRYPDPGSRRNWPSYFSLTIYLLPVPVPATDPAPVTPFAKLILLRASSAATIALAPVVGSRCRRSHSPS